MKKNIKLFILLLFVIGLFSCKKDSYVAAFSELPQVRMQDSISFVKETLTSADNGWIAYMSTEFGGGYGFYMAFDTSFNTNMLSDLTTVSSNTLFQSQYRIKADMGVDLVFDTYNYITELNDPDNNVRNGYGGDLEYIYDHTNGDSIIFNGKRYHNTLNLVKATSQQKNTYINGGYTTVINSFVSFFQKNVGAYFTLEDGTKVAVEPNFSNSLTAGKRLALTSLEADGSIKSANSKFATTIDKMVLLDSGITLLGQKYTNISWKDQSNLAIYTSTGKEYIINPNLIPIIDLWRVLGIKYSTFYSAFKTIYPGTTTDGTTILNYFHSNLTTSAVTGYVFNSGNIKLTWDIINKRLSLIGFSSQNGGSSGWNTTIVYKYEMISEGVYKFTKYSDASGGYVAKLLSPLDSFLLENSVSIDYYTDPSTSIVYGRLSSVQVPTTAMTFILQ